MGHKSKALKDMTEFAKTLPGLRAISINIDYLPYQSWIIEVSSYLALATLNKHNGNLSLAAKECEVDRKTFRRICDKAMAHYERCASIKEAAREVNHGPNI